MTDLVLLCTLPAERASLAPIVVAAGGTPVIDLTASARVVVPDGAWVRVRSRRNVPGTGPVVLVGGGDAAPVRNRETWLEVTTPEVAPEGFAGVVLRGVEAGGPCGASPGLDLLRALPQGTRVILDAGVDPAEAAAAAGLGAVGVVLSIVIARFNGHFDREIFKNSLFAAVRTACMIAFIIAGASFLTSAMGFTQVPMKLAQAIGEMGLSPTMLLIALTLLLLIMGCFLDGISLILLVTAIIMPLVSAAGFDLIWFGILVVVATEISLITPPIGMNVFVLKGVLSDVSVRTIFKGVTPFWIADIFRILLIALVPAIALLLPSMML